MTQKGSLIEWLTRLGVNRQLNNNDILSGVTINATLSKIIPEYNLTLLNTNTAASRINNWNLIVNQLAKVGVQVNQQMKSKILNGDDKVVYTILYELKNHYDKGREEVQVDISKIDSRGDPKTAKSLLQLLILVIIKYYGFSVKEAVALLSNDSKYLAHILAKGFKDHPQPVQGMLLELLRLLPQITTFCRNKQNQTFFLKSIKPALISKFLSIAEVSLELITQFTKQISQKLDVVKTQLLPTLILGLRRHSCQLGPIVHSLTEILGYNKNLLPFLMNATHPHETYLLIVQFLNQAERNNHVSEVFQMFRFQQFVDHSIQNLRDSQLFINAGTFFLKTIELNYNHVSSEQLNKAVDYLSMLNLSRRSQVIIFSNLIFAFLHTFGRRKNPIAPQFFKLAVDKYRSTINQDESHNYLMNFLDIMDIFPSIPTAGIVEAILFRYETSTAYIGQLELSIIENSIGYVDEKGALRVYNIITKIFVQEVGSVDAITNIIETMIRKFDSKLMFELNIKFMKVCLAIYYANIRKLNYSKSLIEGSIKLDEANAFYKAKNLEIEKLLSGILTIKDENINIAIQPLVCYTYFQSELKNKNQAEGIKQVMLILGDEQQLRKVYEADAKLLLEDARNEGRKKVDHKNKQSDSKIRAISDASLLVKKKDYLLHNPPKVPVDAQKGLQKYTKVFKEKMVKLSLEQERKLQDIERQEELRRKFTLKILEKGIKIQKDVTVGCIYEFNSKQKQQLKDYANDFSSLPFYDPQLEEDQDVKSIQYLIKKYNKLFKVYYHQYGGKLRPNTLKLFEDLSHTAYLMQTANVWKLLRDNNLDLFITVKEVQHTVQKINAHLKKQYQDSSLLDFEVFQNFLIQASQIMFSRPPKDMRARPVSDMLQQVVNKLKEHAPQNKIDLKLFQEPQTYQSNKTEEIKQINQKLIENPDYILPEGYKKVTTKKVEFEYKVKVDEAIGVHESSQQILEMLDEIFSEHLGFHIIEPYSSTIVEAVARPILYQTSMDASMKQRSLSSALPKSSRYKESIAKDATDGQGELNELNESRSPGGSRIQNKYLKERKQKQEQKQRKLEEEQKRRQQRDRQLKALLEKHKEKQTEAEEERLQRIRKQNERKEEEKRKRQKHEQDLKKKVEEFMKKKEQQKTKQEQQKRRQREEQIRNLQKMKEDIKRKKRMVEQHRLQKQQEQQDKKAKERAEQQELERQRKAKEQQRREKQKQLIEEYKQKKQKEEQEKKKKKELEEEEPKQSKVKLKTSAVKKRSKQIKPEQVKGKQEAPPKDVKVEDL